MKNIKHQSKHAKYHTKNPISDYLVDNFMSSLKSLVSTIEFNSVLDVGCGEGIVLNSISEIVKNKSCDAIDIGPIEVEHAKKIIPFCNVSVGSIFKIPFEDSSKELVICSEVLEHLENPKAALNELHRVSSKYILVSVPREPLWRAMNMARLSYLKDFGNTPDHRNHWSQTGFKKFVSSKFDILDVAAPIPWTIILAQKK